MILGIGRLREAARTPEKGAGGAERGLSGLGKQQKPAITVSIRRKELSFGNFRRLCYQGGSFPKAKMLVFNLGTHGFSRIEPNEMFVMATLF